MKLIWTLALLFILQVGWAMPPSPLCSEAQVVPANLKVPPRQDGCDLNFKRLKTCVLLYWQPLEKNGFQVSLVALDSVLGLLNPVRMTRAELGMWMKQKRHRGPEIQINQSDSGFILQPVHPTMEGVWELVIELNFMNQSETLIYPITVLRK